MSGHVLNLSLNLDRIGPEIPKNSFFLQSQPQNRLQTVKPGSIKVKQHILQL
jgi:hypothetical protein